MTTGIEMVIGSLKHLAEDVELTLLIGIVAYPYRPGNPVSPEMTEHLLVKGVHKINIIEDLGFRPAFAAYFQQPFHEPTGLFLMPQGNKCV